METRMKLLNKSTYSANVRRGFALTLFIATPLFCAAETWTDAALVDANCAAKVKSNPDAHTKDCALKCSKSGYGILTADGTFLKFDSQGNEQATTALKGYQRPTICVRPLPVNATATRSKSSRSKCSALLRNQLAPGEIDLTRSALLAAGSCR